MPLLRHVATCLSCGFREATKPTRAYLTRCPNDGNTLEHATVTFYDRAELARVSREGTKRALIR